MKQKTNADLYLMKDSHKKGFKLLSNTTEQSLPNNKWITNVTIS